MDPRLNTSGMTGLGGASEMIGLEQLEDEKVVHISVVY